MQWWGRGRAVGGSSGAARVRAAGRRTSALRAHDVARGVGVRHHARVLGGLEHALELDGLAVAHLHPRLAVRREALLARAAAHVRVARLLLAVRARARQQRVALFDGEDLDLDARRLEGRLAHALWPQQELARLAAGGGQACWSRAENPQLWGGLRRAPEATASFQDAPAALRGAKERPGPSDGPGRQMGRCRQTG